MSHDLFYRQKEIGNRLLNYIQQHGYSKSSFSKLVEISRPTLNLVFEGDVTSATTYEKHLEKITQSLQIPLDYFLSDQTPPMGHKAFFVRETPHYTASDRAPADHQWSATTTRHFQLLEDVFHLMNLYLEKGDGFVQKLARSNSIKITRENLDDVVESNQLIRDDIEKHIEIFSHNHVGQTRMSRDKLALDILKKHHLIQVPISDCYFGGAIRELKQGRRVPVINTSQPRLYQYFVYWHELYHLLFDQELQEQYHEVSIELDIRERKADYFAALMLLKDEVYDYYTSLTNMDFYRKMAFCMDSYKAPYKAILIQLYESALYKKDFRTKRDVWDYFDRKLSIEEWVRVFDDMGLDSTILKPSDVISFGGLPEIIEKEIEENEDLSHHQHNLDFLKEIHREFSIKKVDAFFEVNGQRYFFECKRLSTTKAPEIIDFISQRVEQKEDQTWEVELKFQVEEKPL